MTTPFKKKHFIIMLALCILVSISKIVYAPLCLLLFTIPTQRFGKLNKKIISIFCIGAITLIAYLSWYFISPPIRSVSDSSAQIALIISNPLLFISIILRSLSTHATLYLSGMLGGYLEWFNVVLSMLYILPSYTIFVLLCAKERCTAFISKPFKILSIIIFTIITIFTFTAMFIEWTKVGETIIDGVQGRYFLPILLLVPIFFLPIKKFTSKSMEQKQLKLISNLKQDYYLYGFLIFESIYAITAMACTHL